MMKKRSRNRSRSRTEFRCTLLAKSTLPHSEKSEVELELRLLEALEIYPPAKLRGPHRHFVLYGLTEYMRRSFNRPFTAEDILKLLGRFYNLDMVIQTIDRVKYCLPSAQFQKPDDEDAEFLNQEEDFRLPQSYLVEEDT
ncbi:UNVERIFIED_CONTAM: hypothetical protein Slati_3111100 [Sesamum latifolium]|uniref:Uncharacterized protein n=1 Tax=Sesamum latifolium TaxID=2727402 RepID=A0AAW2UV74_9LAMI